MAYRLFAGAAGYGSMGRGILRDLSPREQQFFQEGEQGAEEERSYADSDDAGIDQIRTVELLGGLHHSSHTFLPVHDFSEDHVGPADVIEDAEGRKNAREGSTEHQP